MLEHNRENDFYSLNPHQEKTSSPILMILSRIYFSTAATMIVILCALNLIGQG